ncbi:MAG: hypothetical protein A2Z20_02565 [Bdellovibrionales bacterium RBG_16_40_8]|nr:MAG: hypothetical protein A2Z20_02565 [Bdellovibrionales bacterium RBG_16_40_8]
MKLTKKMTLEQFAIAVAAELKKHDIDVILTGGAVVAIYSTGKYVSMDADFLSATDHKTITQVMKNLGFKNVGKDFYHDDTDFSVEFTGSQLIIGNSPMKPDGKIERKGFTLRLLSPTQCVMDRLAAFYHWRDRQSLDQALLVANFHPIKIKQIEEWSALEGEKTKFDEFKNKLKGLNTKKGRK